MKEQIACLLNENYNQLNNPSISFVPYSYILFQVIVLLKADFNWSNSFTLAWVDKVTTGT